MLRLRPHHLLTFGRDVHLASTSTISLSVHNTRFFTVGDISLSTSSHAPTQEHQAIESFVVGSRRGKLDITIV